MKHNLKLTCSCGKEHDCLIITSGMDEDEIICMCGLVWQVKAKKPAPTLKKGDKVRHSKSPEYGTGIVIDIAKSGKRAMVDFGSIKDYDKVAFRFCKPDRAYFEISRLELVENA